MHCRKCGAEALQSSQFCRLCGSKIKPKSDLLWRLRMAAIAILLIIIGLLIIASSGHAQTKGVVEQKPRQVWLRLKSGPILTGDLVKMDPDSVEFKVKGILQSVKCDELIGVMFIPPTPKPAPTPAATPGPTPAQPAPPAPAPAPAPSEPVVEVTPPTIFPDHCDKQQITINPAQYHHHHVSNSLRPFHYTGDFSVHGGKITVYIVDPDNFTKFANHKKFTAFYAAEKVTDGRFDIPCQQGQIYHVIVLNDSAYDVRLVDTNFCFTHIGE